MPIKCHSEAMRTELLGQTEVRVPALATVDTTAVVAGLVLDAEVEQFLIFADPDSDNFLP